MYKGNFQYVTAVFPLATSSPQTVYAFELNQKRYEHETGKITFKDWGLDFEAVTTNSPVEITIYGTYESRKFYGYVDYVTPCITPGHNYTEVGIIGASGMMRQGNQNVYKNITADQVIKQISNKYGFGCFIEPHPRVYPQIAQAGNSDWQLMARLAKQCGYSLRTQNTEVYFQSMFYDYTKYRSNAKTFSLQGPEGPVGTTIYSFEPVIGDAIQYPDAFKSAVAVSGIDKFSQSTIKTAKQSRNKKTRRKQKPELFDKFSTEVVVNDPETAKHEAEAADNRNSYPYRAWVEVLGEPTLRPDMPVYLENIGRTYSGFWTILATEHRVLETELNQQTYTTILYVGTDSLGLADVWVDNKTVYSPNKKQKREIIPNVRQTNVIPKSSLIIKDKFFTPQEVVDFGLVKNRKAAKEVSARIPMWKSDVSSLNQITVEVKKPAAIIARLQRIGQL